MKQIKSTNIDAIGYNVDTKVLSVKFRVGGIYHYENVKPEVYDALEKAESIGKYFAQNIRNIYKFVKEEKTQEQK